MFRVSDTAFIDFPKEPDSAGCGRQQEKPVSPQPTWEAGVRSPVFMPGKRQHAASWLNEKLEIHPVLFAPVPTSHWNVKRPQTDASTCPSSHSRKPNDVGST